MRRLLALLLGAALIGTVPLCAAKPGASAQATTVELSAEASRAAANDLATAVLGSQFQSVE